MKCEDYTAHTGSISVTHSFYILIKEQHHDIVLFYLQK